MPICMELYVITPQNESYKIKSAVTCELGNSLVTALFLYNIINYMFLTAAVSPGTNCFFLETPPSTNTP